MKYIIFFISIIVYYVSPDEFNYSYILIIFSLFLLSAYVSIKDQVRNNDFFSFNVLFLISFFLTSFAYPVFIKPLNIYIWLSYLINENFITKTTALCQIAFSAYVLGMNIKNKKNTTATQHIIVKSSPIVYLYIPLLALMFFLAGYLNISKEDTINFNVGWSAFSYILLSIYTIILIGFSGPNSLLYKNKWILLSVILLVSFLLLFTIGDRGIAILIIIALFAVFSNYIKRIKFLYLLIYGSLAVVLLFSISQVRMEGDILENLNKERASNVDTKWEYFSDLTSISRNIYVGYEYKEKHGYYKPERIFLIAISPIPYLPSLISNTIFNDSYSSYSSTARVITNYSSLYKEGSELSGGLGTHCVIDIYMSWGLIGVIIMFFILGRIISISYARINYNIYYAAIYFVLTAYSIYMPRSTIYESYRLIILLMFLIFILKPVTYKLIKKT